MMEVSRERSDRRCRRTVIPLDGPVVTAARKALEGRDVDQTLPYVPEAGEPEVREAFGLTTKARTLGQEAQEVADRWFFETVVRVHRSGEGAPSRSSSRPGSMSDR